jgi:hypothetical protein
MNWLNNFFQGLGGVFPSCKEAVRLQSDALDGHLPFGRQIGLHLHLLMCKWCRRYGRQIAFLRLVAHSHPKDTLGAGGPVLSPEAKRKMKDRLKQGDKE